MSVNAIVQSLVVSLVAGVVAALATNYFASRFSFARFRKEQWWSEKREAYHSIIRRLSEIAFNTSAQITNEESGGEISPSAVPARDKSLAWSLQEIASSGAYVVSEKTAKAVEKFLNAYASSDAICGGDIHAMLSRDYDAVQEALTVVRAEAHRELEVS
jgi:hypothetical protein